MINNNNFPSVDHIDIRDMQPKFTRHHWCEDSQAYSSADILFKLLDSGCTFSERVVCQQYHGYSTSVIELYYFYLKRTDGRICRVPVVRNPVVMRLIKAYDLQVDYQTP